MTEGDWLTSTDPQTMLAFVQDSSRATDRKRRLFAAACCRRIWHLLSDERSRRAVGAAEREADGLVGPEERHQATLEAALAFAEAGAVADVATPELPSALDWFYDQEDAERTRDAYQRSYQAALATVLAHSATANAAALAALATHAAVSPPPHIEAELAAGHAAFAAAFAGGPGDAPEVGDPVELAAQCRLLRCVFGNLFRPLLPDPAWRTPTVVSLAHAAYEERLLPSGELDPARLAVLCDALLDAGCPPDHELLTHLRGPGPHVRGCWTVDCLTARG
jgi:hypothetical protein